MKIGIVCNALANSGRMERYTLDIIRGFVSAGHELTVFTRKIDRSLYEATLVKTVKINASFLPKRLRDFYISNLLLLIFITLKYFCIFLKSISDFCYHTR